MRLTALIFILIFMNISILANDFIIGVDVSTLYEIEKAGGKYYDSGVEKSCLEILKDHGVNWVRLRVWNDPTDHGEPLGGGNCDYVKMTQIAMRAKAAGLKVLVDFHYSDWWADPGKQNKPKAWAELHGDDLQNAIYNYTREVLIYMRQNQASPDMVQIGNEINNGFLWPDGQISGQNAGGFDGFVRLAKKAIKAVREVDPSIKIMLHLADGGNNPLYRWFFDEMVRQNVDFDVIGVSYYPYWHGSLKDLSENLNDIARRYDKDIVIAETAYAWTLQDFDGYPNIFGEQQEHIAGYDASIEGQKAFLSDLIRTLKSVSRGKCKGFFYWEGAWIPVKGVGWKINEGNPWENQALFDFHGNLLDTVEIFESPFEKVAVLKEFSLPIIEVFLGEKPELPGSVKAAFSDGSVRPVEVQWEEIPAEDLNTPGEHVVKGVITSTGEKIEATVIVKEERNYLQNASFELAVLEPWQVAGNREVVKVIRADPPQNAHHGKYALNYWLDKDFEFELYQTVTNLPDGVYTVSMWIQGGGSDTVYLKISEYGGPEKSVKIVNTGWLKWNNPQLKNIQITTGKIKISVIVRGKSGNWGWIDEFKLMREVQ